MPNTKTKPASKKPANKKPAAKPAVTLAMVAERLGVSNTKALRVRVRRILGDGKAVVGKGKRYGWNSWKDRELVRLMKALQTNS
jgi:hypothetical protein